MASRTARGRRVVKRAGVLAKNQISNLWLNGFVSSGVVPDRARWLLLRASGVHAERSVIDAGGFIGSRRITIGHGCSINRNVFLDGSAPITIGDQVSIAMNVLILTGSHEIAEATKRAGALTSAPVTIEDGAWIGAGAIIVPGITIGRGAIVASGSVVMKDVAANTVVMGNPARLVRRMDDDAGTTAIH